MGMFFDKSLKIAGLILLGALSGSGLAQAHGNGREPMEGHFTFEGPFGVYDQAQLQRGYKVYREVCSACHAMKLLSFRNLGEKYGPFYDPKYPNPNDNPVVKQIASEFEVSDIDPDTGDEMKRKATSSDRFPSPFKNVEAATASNGGAAPPDLSVMAKARPGGAAYVMSLVGKTEEAPAGVTLSSGQYYYPYVNGVLKDAKGRNVEGGVLAMPPPLTDGRVTFDDGHPNKQINQAEDVAAFLEWAADPHKVSREQTGMIVMIYLLLMAGVTYIAYLQVWRGKH